MKVTELVNNAGVSTPDHPHETVTSLKRADLLAVLDTNVAGVAGVMQASGVLHTQGGKVSA